MFCFLVTESRQTEPCIYRRPKGMTTKPSNDNALKQTNKPEEIWSRFGGEGGGRLCKRYNPGRIVRLRGVCPWG